MLVVTAFAVTAMLALGTGLALRWPFAALAVFAVVVPFGSALPLPVPPPLDDVSSVVGALVILALGVRLATSASRPLPVRTTTALWTLLVGAAAMTALWSLDPAGTLLDTVALTSLVLLYALVAATRVSPGDLRLVEVGIVVGGTLVGCYAAYLAATGRLAGVEDQRFVAAPGGDETGANADPNVTAAALLLPFFVAVKAAFRPGTRLVRMGARLAAGSIVIAVFLTGSRGGLLALLVGLGVVIALSPHRAKAATALLVPVLGAAIAISIAPSSVTERVSSDSRSSGRSDIWRIGVLSCPQYCVQGSGWGTFPLVHEERLLTDPAARGVQRRFEAHNIWLSTVVEGGLVALVLLTAGLLATGRGLQRVPRALRSTPLGALVALVVANFFLSTLAFKYFWLVLVYAVLVQNLSTPAAVAPPQLRTREVALR